MSTFIEARVIQKVDTEANWLSNPLKLYSGEIAYVSDKNNFKLNQTSTPKTFSELEYYYKGDILGGVLPTDDLASKPDGVYRAKVNGDYNGIVAKEGYYTLLRKKDGVWSLESEVKIPTYDDLPLKNALNLSGSFPISETIPDDRSDVSLSHDFYSTTNYYYEGDNHNGVKFINIVSKENGQVKIAIATINTTATIIESKTINVIQGLNTISISDVGFKSTSLAISKFVIAVSPTTMNLLPFDSQAGELSLFVASSGAIINTNYRGCVWLNIEKEPYLLTDYPITKDNLQKTINKENTYIDKLMPYDKSKLSFNINSSVGILYGSEDTYYNVANVFKNLKIKAISSGFVNVYFGNIIDNSFKIIHTTQVSCSVGINTFDSNSLSAPTGKNSDNIYILIGSVENQTTNVVQGLGDESSTDRFYFTYNLSTNTLTKTSGKVGFNFWLTVSEPTNKLVAEVERLALLVDNQISNDETIYDYKNNAPILPCDLFIDKKSPTPLFKDSLFQKYIGQDLPSVKLISNNKTINIQDPTHIDYNDVNSVAKILIDKHLEPNTILYKNLNVHKFDSSTKSGTIKIMSFGDSLTEGGAGFSSSPIYLLTQQLANNNIAVEGVGTIQRTSGGITQRYNGQGGWRYRTFIGMESQFADINVTIPNANKNVFIEGVDGDITTIKSNNFFLYEATLQDLIDYPEFCFHFVNGSTTNNVSYAENPNLGTYHIFSPARYFSERGIDFPDVITIALGTNEWYLGGFSAWDLPLITKSADWLIQRFLDAVPSTTAVVVIPCNNMPLTRENEWQTKASLLTSSVLKIIETKKITHSNLYALSIYAHGSRQLAFNKELSVADLSVNNTTKVAIIDSDVHILNTNDEGRSDYINALSKSILYFVK